MLLVYVCAAVLTEREPSSKFNSSCRVTCDVNCAAQFRSGKTAPFFNSGNSAGSHILAE